MKKAGNAMMVRSNLCRRAVSVGAIAAMLAGCAVRDNAPVSPGAVPHAAAASSYEVLYRFEGGSNGAHPAGNLVSVKGTLYGTAGGGSAGKGIVYSVTTAGEEKLLHDFKGADGADPQAGLIDVNGTLYGTTYAGRGKGLGVVYAISTSGAEKLLHAFAGGLDGEHPEAGLVDVGGMLYGTTFDGGGGSCTVTGRHDGCGTVYSITTTGTEKVLGTFSGEPDGERPEASVIGMNGSLWGTTYFGGPDAQGTVFRVTMAGAEKVVHGFGAGTDGRDPQAALIDVKGTLYGTTVYGGDVSKYKGTVFSMHTDGAEEILHNFNGSPDGANPQANLIYVNGTLYGTTQNGGANNKGTIYSISTTGAEKVLYSFAGGSDGAYPSSGLVDVNGTLYGTTTDGGSGMGDGSGTVYSLSP